MSAANTASNPTANPPISLPVPQLDPPAIVQNRLPAIMAHTFWYAFEPQARLAKDAGVSRSTVSRLITGKINPSFRLVQAITSALTKRLNDTMDVPMTAPLDPREVFSTDGYYPTASVCELAGCSGCLPEEAYDRHNVRKPEYRRMKPGDWCRAPKRTEPVEQTAPA